MKQLAVLLCVVAFVGRSADEAPPPLPDETEAAVDTVWYEGFNYADEADFEANAFNQEGGSRLIPHGRFSSECLVRLVSLDGDAMRYDYWDRNADPTGAQTIGLECATEDPAFSMSIAAGRMFRPPVQGPELWVKMVSKEGTPDGSFSIGCETPEIDCGEKGGLYKFFLDDAVFAVQMAVTPGDARTGHRLAFLGLGLSACRIEHPGIGKYHTYVWGYYTDGDGVVHYAVYIDDKLQCSGVYGGKSGAVSNLRPGWNMNSGPQQAQSRWIDEVGLYRSRP